METKDLPVGRFNDPEATKRMESALRRALNMPSRRQKREHEAAKSLFRKIDRSFRLG
jgi:trehalose-6-phosphate synthase